MSDLTGRCLCGAVEYRISAQPVVTRVCWCRACQHIASNGTVNMIVATDAMEISGKLSEFQNLADSGTEMRRRFCPVCGSHLFVNAASRPQFTGVRVGTLDDPSAVRPAVNIWVSQAPAWARLDDALECVDRQPGPPQPQPQQK
jgi:hypothetical protein